MSKAVFEIAERENSAAVRVSAQVLLLLLANRYYCQCIMCLWIG